jgi:hypothetical protein
MAHVIFFTKPGCLTDSKQLELLKQAVSKRNSERPMSSVI